MSDPNVRFIQPSIVQHEALQFEIHGIVCLLAILWLRAEDVFGAAAEARDEILVFFQHRRSHRRADMPKCLSFLPVVLDAHSAELRYATHAHA